MRQKGDCLNSRPATEFLHDVVEVVTYSRLRNSRELGYFRIMIALCQGSHAIPLSCCESGLVEIAGNLSFHGTACNAHEMKRDFEQIPFEIRNNIVDVAPVSVARPNNYRNLPFGTCPMLTVPLKVRGSNDACAVTNVVLNLARFCIAR